MKKLLPVVLPVLVVASFAFAPSAADASGEIQFFDGTRERMDNVDFTVKPVGDTYLVFTGTNTTNPSDAILAMRGNRIYWGNQLTNSNVAFTVRGSQIFPGLTVRSVDALWTIRANRIFLGARKSMANIGFTLTGTHDRTWVYVGGQATGIPNLRFTVRGNVDDILPLVPILADLN